MLKNALRQNALDHLVGSRQRSFGALLLRADVHRWVFCLKKGNNLPAMHGIFHFAVECHDALGNYFARVCEPIVQRLVGPLDSGVPQLLRIALVVRDAGRLATK